MKKFILAFCFLAFVIACNSSKKQSGEDVTIDYSNADKDYAATAAPEAAKPAVDETDGLALIESSDCLGCHKADSKLIGPSYKEVAAKYTAADTDMLAQKIIDGGKGNWGEVPMTAHPGVSMEHAKTMVGYILSLK